jgi:hypothetical protein
MMMRDRSSTRVVEYAPGMPGLETKLKLADLGYNPGDPRRRDELGPRVIYFEPGFAAFWAASSSARAPARIPTIP